MGKDVEVPCSLPVPQVCCAQPAEHHGLLGGSWGRGAGAGSGGEERGRKRRKEVGRGKGGGRGGQPDQAPLAAGLLPAAFSGHHCSCPASRHRSSASTALLSPSRVPCQVAGALSVDGSLLHFWDLLHVGRTPGDH